MEITTELISKLDKLITLIQFDVFQLCATFNEYLIDMYFFDDEIQVIIYDESDNLIIKLINRDNKWIY